MNSPPPQPHTEDPESGSITAPDAQIRSPHQPYYIPVLVQGQLLGEQLKEAGAVGTVLLRGAHNTNGRDQKVGTGLCGFVHQQGHARSYRNAHALQGTQKLNPEAQGRAGLVSRSGGAKSLNVGVRRIRVWGTLPRNHGSQSCQGHAWERQPGRDLGREDGTREVRG